MDTSQLIVVVIIILAWRMPNIIDSVTQYRKENRKREQESNK